MRVSVTAWRTKACRAIIPVMRGGKRVSLAAPLAGSQRRCQTQLERLPVALRALAVAEPPYPVRHSARLEALLEEVRERTMRTVAREQQVRPGFPQSHLLGRRYADRFHAAWCKLYVADAEKLIPNLKLRDRPGPQRPRLPRFGRVRPRAR